MKVNKTRWGRRFAGVLGAVSLGIAGAAGVAYADEFDLSPQNINPEETGSLTVHKFGMMPNQGPWPAYDFPADGKQVATIPDTLAPLEGVEFEVVPVLRTPGFDSNFDLTTMAGWDDIQGLNALTIDAAVHDAAASTGYVFGTKIKKPTLDTGEAVFPGLGLGLYLVHEVSTGNNPVTNPVEPFLVTIPYPNEDDSTWIYNVHVYPKNGLCDCEVAKEVVDPGQVIQPDGTIVTSGANVDWKITVPLTVVDEHNPLTFFEVFDALDSRLTYVEDSAVFDYYDTTVSPGGTATKAGTLILGTDFIEDWDEDENTLTITIDSDTTSGLTKLNDAGATWVQITITTEVDGAGIIENTVESLVNEWESAVLQGDGPTTNWAPLRILKVADEAKKATTLQGAEFEVYRAALDADKNLILGTKISGPYTTDENGEINVNLWVGNNDNVGPTTYFVKETKAPAGYVLPTDPWTRVDLTATEAATVKIEKIANVQQDGPQLPLTGANGQMLLMLGGAGLALIGAGAAAVARKRSKSA